MIMNFACYNKWLFIGSANKYSMFYVAQQSIENILTCSIFDWVLKTEMVLMPLNFINEDLRMPVDFAGKMVMANCLLLLQIKW